MVCQFLAGKCLLEAREHMDALAVLNGEEGETSTRSNNSVTAGTHNSLLEPGDTNVDGFSVGSVSSNNFYWNE
jgi:hypothetical protein